MKEKSRMERIGQQKSPRPPINTEGTRALEMFCSRGTTPIVTTCNNASSSQLCDEGFVTTFTGSLAAWEPATCPTCLSLRKGFLRSAAHDAVLSWYIHSELPPNFGSLLEIHLILCSLNAGQTLYVVVILKHSSRLAKCQISIFISLNRKDDRVVPVGATRQRAGS